MKKLFLSSSFNDVADLFQDFAQEDIKGKTVSFIPTASLPEKIKFYVGSAKKAFEKLGMIVDELELTKLTNAEVAEKLRKNNYIYVSGGNTFFLLQELKKKGADKIIEEQIESGKIYIGESAGTMIVSPNIEYAKGLDDCKVATELDAFSSLNIIDFYPLPHFGNFPFKKAVEKTISKYESELSLYPISNSQAILIDGTEVNMATK